MSLWEHFEWLCEEKYWKIYKIDHEVKFECFGQHKMFIEGNKGQLSLKSQWTWFVREKEEKHKLWELS